MNTNGPTTINIPERSDLSCVFCRYLKRKELYRSHTRSEDEYGCSHPKATDARYPVYTDAQKERAKRWAAENGEYIGKSDTTPSWCPVQKFGE